MPENNVVFLLLCELTWSDAGGVNTWFYYMETELTKV